MTITYNNTDYNFSSNLSLANFVELPYIIPIDVWKQASQELYGGFQIDLCKSILKETSKRIYNNSNHFIYNENEYWISKEDRNSILQLLNSRDDFQLILGENVISINKDTCIKFLNDLNNYSYECKLAYAKSLQIINELTEISDIDFNYPDKINLNNYF